MMGAARFDDQIKNGKAILEHLDDLEAEYLSDLVLKRVQKGQEQTYTLDELERELGRAD